VIGCKVGHIHDDSNEIVPIEDSAMAPVAFHLLGLVTGGSEMINDFQHGFSQPFRRNRPSVIKLEG
jgi:hypothetical protein